MEERRAPVELDVEYVRLNTFFSDYLKNISKGGTFIKTSRPLEVGTRLVFALRIPTLPEPLRLRGAVNFVVRPSAATTERPAGMGIEFEYPSEQERRRVEGQVETLMTRELGAPLAGRLLSGSVTR